MRRSPGTGREYEDTVYFNPYTGEHLATWRYGVNESLGDWLIWLQVPLHFGTAWGLAVKIIWATAGLVLPLLAISGLVMPGCKVQTYGNRPVFAARNCHF